MDLFRRFPVLQLHTLLLNTDFKCAIRTTKRTFLGFCWLVNYFLSIIRNPLSLIATQETFEI